MSSSVGSNDIASVGVDDGIPVGIKDGTSTGIDDDDDGASLGIDDDDDVEVGVDDDDDASLGIDGDDDDTSKEVLFLHYKAGKLKDRGYFFSSSSIPATEDLAISRIDLSALLIRKLVSRTVVIVPITPPVVTTRSPAFNCEIVSCSWRCRFC